MKKIVFYIRALFGESISPKIENYDARIVVNNFNKFSNITAEKYREKVHEIQIKCLKNISENVIYNILDQYTNKNWPYTYDVLQKTTIEKLKKLDDDAILIPLDDDDWLSPKVADINFCKNGLTIWNTISITSDSYNKNIFYHMKNLHLPNHVEDKNDSINLRSLLSNCMAISGNVVKKMIEMDQTTQLQRLLQRHTEPRKVIREPIFSHLDLREIVLDDYLAVYVKHACNITDIKILGGPDSDEKMYNKLVERYKKMNYVQLLKDVPPNYEWCKEYCNLLGNLHAKL